MNLRKSKLLHCSFCGKSHVEAKKLIAGPYIYICDECALDFSISTKEAELTNLPSEMCSFCGKKGREVESIVQRNSLRICNECLEICREIISYEAEEAKI